jgi:hypothetical protein
MFSVLLPVVPVFLERKLRASIKHATLICHGHEDTKQCKIAWDRVEDIQKAINMKKEREQCEWDEKACREYDV